MLQSVRAWWIFSVHDLFVWQHSLFIWRWLIQGFQTKMTHCGQRIMCLSLKIGYPQNLMISHGLVLVYHHFSICVLFWTAIPPGLIWVNPRFVHLDKSTTLEEAPPRGESPQVAVPKKALVVPSGKRLHNELERSTMLWKWVNQLFRLGPFSSSQTVWNYQRVVPNLYFFWRLWSWLGTWCLAIAQRRPCTTAAFASKMWWRGCRVDPQKSGADLVTWWWDDTVIYP